MLNNPQAFRGTLPGFSNYQKNPDYFVSQSFSYYGFVYCEKTEDIIIVGPVFSTPYSDFTLKNFMRELAIHPDYKEEISRFLSSTPAISFDKFIQTLSFLYQCLNDKAIDINQHFDLLNTDSIHTLSNIHTNKIYESKENQNFHNTWHFEQKMMHYVQNGEVEHLKELITNTTSVNLEEGIVADNALRQRKNIFISSVALTTRSAISGGMGIEEAYQLSDVYINECEKSQSISHISQLSYSMLLDFAERVAKNKMPKDMSPDIFKCIQYITSHVNEPIQVSDVADFIGKSRSNLSVRFKKELGFDIGTFIMRCKLEEAKSLLAHSDKTLSEISTYLCFSSQSYFQNVFKKKYGITPKKFRDQSHRPD